MLINQILNLNRSHVDHSNAGHQFYTKTPSLMSLLHLQKKSKCNTKQEYFSLKYEIYLSVSSKFRCDLKIYHTNTRHQFCMNSILPPWRSILYLRENSKCNIKAAYLSINMTVSMLILYQKFQTLSKLSILIVICTKWNYYNSSNIEFKQINSLLQWFQTSVLRKDTLTFLRPILYSQKISNYMSNWYLFP